MNPTRLTPTEEERVRAFLARSDVKDLIYHGAGSWSIVWGPHTGIGVPVQVTAANKTRSTILTESISDYASW